MYDKVKIAKLLANSDPVKRNKAYNSIKVILKRSFGEKTECINSNEILGIWKGLFEWLKYQDKMLLQEEVVAKISDLLISYIKDDEVALEFINSYSLTMQREWKTISIAFKDKFMMLVREMNKSIFKWLQKSSWKQWDNVLQYLVSTKVSTASLDLCIHMVETLIDEAKTELTVDLSTKLVMHIFNWACNNNLEPNQTLAKISQYTLKRISSAELQINSDEFSIYLFNIAKRPNISAAKRKSYYHYVKKLKQVEDFISNDSKFNKVINSENKDLSKINNLQGLLSTKTKKKKSKANAQLITKSGQSVVEDVEMADLESHVTSNQSSFKPNIDKENQNLSDKKVSKNTKKKTKNKESTQLVAKLCQSVVEDVEMADLESHVTLNQETIKSNVPISTNNSLKAFNKIVSDQSSFKANIDKENQNLTDKKVSGEQILSKLKKNTKKKTKNKESTQLVPKLGQCAVDNVDISHVTCKIEKSTMLPIFTNDSDVQSHVTSNRKIEKSTMLPIFTNDSDVKSKFVKNPKADRNYTKLKKVSFGKVYKKKITPTMMMKSFCNGSIQSNDDNGFKVHKSILKKKANKICRKF